MRTSPFNSKYRITQKYGENPEYYQPYGFLGHEGIDLVPTGTVWNVYCMEAGVCVRDIDTPRDNYGKYVVILNMETKRAFWYCHLDSNSVSVGDVVAEGQVIGVMGNTGASTGAHLHLGLRECDSAGNAINTTNGYKGFIDPLTIISDMTTTNPDALTECLRQHTELVNLCNEKDKKIATLEIDLKAVQQANEENIQASKEVLAKLEESKEMVSTLTAQLTEADSRIKTLTEQVNSQTLTIANLEKEIKDLTLKLSSIPENENLTPTLSNVISLFRLWLKRWLK